MKVQAIDLRIGNYVIYASMWQRVYSVGETAINIAQEPIKMSFVKGIELSPEILLKCGFSQLPNEILGEDCFSNGTDYYITRDDDLYQIDRVCDLNFQEWDHITGFYYLHELQNIWYFLNKTELTIKP